MRIALPVLLLAVVLAGCSRPEHVTWRCVADACPNPDPIIEAHRQAWELADFSGCTVGEIEPPAIPFDYDRYSKFVEIVLVDPNGWPPYGWHVGEERRVFVELVPAWESVLWHEMNLAVMWLWAGIADDE